MKKNQFAQPFGRNTLALGNRGGLLYISALDLRNAHDQKEFVLFAPANGQKNLRLIAAPTPINPNEGCRFGIRLQNNSGYRMAVVVYVNGKSIVDERDLSAIPEFLRNNYEAHGSKFCLNPGESSTKDHAIIRGQTPALCFVQQGLGLGYAETSWNYDPSAANQIQVFAWLESEKPQQNLRSSGLQSFRGDAELESTRSTKSAQPTVGLGQDTGHKYQNVSELYRPQYLGESVIVYLSEADFAAQGHERFSVGRFDRLDLDHLDNNNLTNLIPPGDPYRRVIG